MSKYSNSIHYSVTTSLDASGLTKLQAEIKGVESELQKLAGQEIISQQSLSKALSQITTLKDALNNAFNANIGMLDMSRFQKEIKSSIGNIQELRSSFSLAGSTGEKAFVGVVGRLGQLDTGIKSISKTTDKMMNTIGNTMRWGVVASGFSQIMNSAHQAVQYVQDLDESLTNIMMVTGQSREQMNAYAQTANEVAKQLKSTTVAMTDATLVFAQQGFNTETSTQLAKRSTQLANISQQDTATTSDQITTMMNAYNFSGNLEEIDAAMDSWAQVANDSAADVQELATASQKAASTAYTVGLTMDQLNAQIATIESVTREAPENIGNALKTIYSRFADISLGETLEDGVDLGTIAQTLGKVGVNVLDDAGDLRNVGDIMEDLMGVWDTMSQTDQSAISTVIAGRYQLSRFQALMNRSDLYNQYLESSMNAEGTADQMQQIFEESLQGRINELQATLEGTFSNIFDTSDFYGLIDTLTQLINLINDFTDAVGGGANALAGLGSVATKVFSNSIAGSINNFLSNRERQKVGKDNISQAQGILSRLGYDNTSDFGASTDLVNFISDGLKYSASMSEEEQTQYNDRIKETVSLKQRQLEYEERILKIVNAVNMANEVNTPGASALLKTKRDEAGNLILDSSEYYKLMREGSVSPDILADNFKQWATSGSSKGKNAKATRLDDISNALRPVQENLTKLFTSINKESKTSNLSDIFSDASSSAQTLGANIDRIKTALGETSSLTEELTNRYNAYRQAIKDVGTDGQVSTDKVKKSLSDLISYMGVLQDTTKLSPEFFNNIDLDKARRDMETSQEQYFQQNKYNDSFLDNQKRKATIDGIVETTASVGQLAYAWTSFQSLGSLFSDDTISDGDKFNSVLLNLAGTLPMVVDSAVTFSSALGLSLPVVGAVIAAISALGIGIGVYQQNLENAKQEQTDLVSKTSEVVSNNSQLIDSFNQLYSSYRQTGEVSDDLKSTSQQLADSLQVQGANALIAAGNYDQLAESIDNANRAAIEDAIDAEKQQQNGWINQSLQGDIFNGSEKADFSAIRANIGGVSEVGQEIATEDFNDALSGSFEDRVKYVNGMVEQLNDTINNIDDQIENASGQDKTNLETKRNEYSAALQEFQDWLNMDDIAAQIESMSNVAGYQAQLIQSSLDGLNNVDDVINTYMSNKDIADYVNMNFNDWADSLGWMIQNTTDETQKLMLEAEQARYKASQMAKVQTGSDKIADNVYDLIGKSGLSNEEVVSLVATLDENTSFENFAKVIQDFENSSSSVLSITANVDTDKLKETIENKSNLNSLVEQYQENGSFTEDEVASIAADNPDYLEYLTKVGDSYKLNTNALVDWNDAVEEQTRALEDAQGKFGSAFFDDYQSDLSMQSSKLSAYSSASETPEVDDMALNGMQNVVNSVQQASQALENGKISVEEYFASYRDAFDSNNIASIFDNLSDYSADTQEAILETAEVLTDGLSDGINQANKQLKNGQMSLTDYNKIMRTAAETALDYNAGLEGLIKQGDDWVQITDEEGDGVENLSDAQEDWIKVNQDTMDSIDMSAASDSINEALTNNYDYLSSILTEYGQLKVPWDSIVGTEQFTSTVSNMASGISSFINSSDANLALFAASMGMTSDQLVSQMGTDSSSIASFMAANEGNFTSATQAMMNTGASAIAQIASGAGQAVGALADMVQDFTATITATPSFSTEVHDVTFDIFGKQFTFGIPLPKFNIDISGQATGDTAGSVKEFAAGLNTLSSGLEGLGGLGGAMSSIGLSDWAPGGSGGTAASPSSFKNPGGSGGSGGSGGGGGGGSGSGSTYEQKEKDPIEEEIDRYERVNTALDAVANDFDRISEEQDRLTGFDQADNMNEQIVLLQRQIALHKEKLSIQKDEAKELQKELSSQYGITFDGEGFITNYAAIHQKLTNQVNSLIAKYNATTTEAGQEALEKQIEAAQDKLDDFKEDYQRYDELVSQDMKDTLKSLEDLEDQIEDLRIEALQTAIEAADNIKDVQESLNEFNQVFSGLQSDDPFRQMALSASNLVNYFDVATKTVDEFYDELISRTEEAMNIKGISKSKKNFYQQQIEMMKEAQASFGDQTMEEYGTGYLDMAMTNLETILAQIKQFEETGTSSIFGKDSGDLYEVAQDVFEQATSMIEDYEGEIDDLRDAILDAIDEIGDEMDRRLEQYENITDELEHQRDIIELIHGEEAYDELNKALAAQQGNYQAQIKEMQQQLDIWEDMQTAMEEGSDEWLAIQEMITDTQSDLNDLIQDSLENLQEQYENTVNKVTDSWVNSALGTDLDWMNDQWELINRNADYYLDDTNAAYEIQKLQGDYLELLDGSNDVAIQQQITEQMKQQLGYLRDKEKISEYDVAYAQAQLEILQKRIALEEAQRNKSQLKLRRDSQGNYSYVYTADEGDVAGAEEDLLDAQNNAYNLSKEQMKQTQDDSLSALQDAQQMLNDIWTNANLTLDEKKERTQTIIDSLKEYLEGTSEQLSTSETNIINDFIGMVEMMTDENNERLQDVYDQIINGNLDAFDQIDTRWSTSLTEWLQNLEEFNASTDGMFEGLIDNATDYQDQIDEVGDLVETDFNDMSDSIQNAVDKTNDLSQSTADFINQLKNDSGTVKEYENTLQEYADKISSVTNEMKAYKDQVNELADKLTAKEQENANLSSQVSDLQNKVNAYENGGSGSGSGSGGSGKDARAGDVVGFKGMYYYDSWGMTPAGNMYAGKKNAVVISSFSGSPYGKPEGKVGSYKVHLETKGGGHLGWVKPSQLFDTGGFTGSWSSSDGQQEANGGKLAWLHQKELVLNAEDTKNMLAVVGIVREITDQMKAGVLSGMISSNNYSQYAQQIASQDINQDVHITAEFPNANSAAEIEQALLSLNDRAIQYSFRK